jgi:predicted restriction endonuclease
VGWAEDHSVRLNPQNGICLNALHDRAFDRHLISFDEDYRLIIAQDVPSEARKSLERIDSPRLALPSRFLPSQSFLERHRRKLHARQQA